MLLWILLTKNLEQELLEELHKKEPEFFYEVQEEKTRFEREIKWRHKKLVKKIRHYLFDGRPEYFDRSSHLVVPGSGFAYGSGGQLFPVRLFSSLRDSKSPSFRLHGVGPEIPELTEQYWCPIKHARRVKSIHSRYKHFFDYGDTDQYRKRIEEVRRSFDDLKTGPSTGRNQD